MNKITVFTPTYNRCYTLSRLADSLLAQTNHDFDWYVIDDGSTDDTEAFFDTLRSRDLPIAIRYEKVANGGKQRAINCAVQNIDSEFTFIVDSDDYLLPDAIEKVMRWVADLPAGVAGVAGVRGNDEIHPIAGWPSFDGDYIEITNLEREKYNLTADMAEIYRTDILKKFPFKVWEGEKFVPEAVVWDEIALQGYPLRWYKEIIYVCEYLEDGLTKGSWNLLKQNPMGYAMLFDHQLLTEKSEKKKWAIALQLVSCCFLAGEWKYIFRTNDVLKTVCCIPAGYALSLRRRKQFKQLEGN